MANNKIIYGGKVLIDLTEDTIMPNKLLQGYTAHDGAGEKITGTCSFDVNSTDGTANQAEILERQTAYARGVKLTGTMPNNGAIDNKISSREQEIIIPPGYHDGSGKVYIDEIERQKLIAGNIKQGVEILGVMGELEPSSSVTAQPMTVVPKTESQVVLPDENIDYISQVTVTAIPYTETANSAGGITVTIAG